MATTETERWVRALLRRDAHLFYVSSRWLAAAQTARARQHNECQRCRAKGLYAPCEAVHHVRRLRDRPDLALSQDNLECLCAACHYAEHHKSAPGFVNPERW